MFPSVIATGRALLVAPHGGDHRHPAGEVSHHPPELDWIDHLAWQSALEIHSLLAACVAGYLLVPAPEARPVARRHQVAPC